MIDVKSEARAVWARHRMTLLGVLLLALSYAVLALRTADVVPLSGVWRALMIPGYLTLLVGAVLSTLLVPTVLFIPLGALLWLAPFAAVDLLIHRRRERTSAA